MKKRKVHPKAMGKYTTLYPPCFYCQQVKDIGTLRKDGDPNSLQGWTCAVYPRFIPEEILKRDFLCGDFVSQIIETGDGPTGWEPIDLYGKYTPTHVKG